MNRRLLYLTGLIAVLLCARALAHSQDGHSPTVGRSVVATEFGIVAASQPLAARAGVEMLERGGNAIDAAIAANATIGLMEPTGNGIGGDLFVIYYEAETGRTYGLNSSGWSATGLSAQFLRSRGETRMPRRTIYSVTVPGVVAGWDALRSRFGTKPFSELLAPAIYYAENGFPLSEVIAGAWSRSLSMLSAHPNSASTFLIDGRAPEAGETFRNPDLAQSLRLIARNGRDAYYEGPIAQAILQVSKEQGGTFTAGDLAEFEPEWVTPITTTYRGWRVSEIPPNTTGIAALIMLNIMERFPLDEWGFHSTKALHVMVEAKKLAYADMIRYVGDPRLSRLPVETLISKSHAEERATHIDMTRAACSVEPSHLEGYTNAEGNDTIYMSAIDKDGNIVSLIQSNYSGFGSGLVPPGTGFMLHNRGDLFTLEEGHPNTLAPRKRPLHTIIPAFMEKDGVRLRDNGRIQPAPGARAVCGQRCRLRDEHPGVARSRPFHKRDIRGLRRQYRSAGPRRRASRAGGSWTRNQRGRSSDGDLWLRPGGDERPIGNPLRRIGAPPRRSGDPPDAAGVPEELAHVRV